MYKQKNTLGSTWTKTDNKDTKIPSISRRRSSNGYLCVIENASAVVGTDDGILPILAEVGGSDEACLTVHLVPQRHLLVWNVPEP